VIHARYAADGSVNEISERPEGVTAQQWFNTLCLKAPNAAHALAGGRMIFRINASELDALKAAAAA
jgi:hypothetical protein